MLDSMFEIKILWCYGTYDVVTDSVFICSTWEQSEEKQSKFPFENA